MLQDQLPALHSNLTCFAGCEGFKLTMHSIPSASSIVPIHKQPLQQRCFKHPNQGSLDPSIQLWTLRAQVSSSCIHISGNTYPLMTTKPVCTTGAVSRREGLQSILCTLQQRKHCQRLTWNLPILSEPTKSCRAGESMLPPPAPPAACFRLFLGFSPSESSSSCSSSPSSSSSTSSWPLSSAAAAFRLAFVLEAAFLGASFLAAAASAVALRLGCGSSSASASASKWSAQPLVHQPLGDNCSFSYQSAPALPEQ